jgi:photosystem II stability/assembly factor-like uncharacterized protein
MKTIIFILAFTFSLSLKSPAQEQWVETATRPDGAGITDMVVTPQGALIVTTASWSSLQGFLGGVRRSTNEGQSWENPLDGFNGRTLHLGSNGVVFASFWPFPLEEAIYRSTNDGVNWTRLYSVNTGDNIFSISSKDNNSTIFIGTRNGVQRSTNSGVNWSYVNNGIPVNTWVRDLEIDSSSGIIAAATTNGFYTSTTNGASWQRTNGIPQDTIISVSFVPELTEGQAMMMATSDGELFKASPSNQTFAQFVATLYPGELGDITPTAFLAPWIMIFRYSTDPNEPNGGVLVSEDGGMNWQYLNSGLPANPPASAITVKSYIPGIKTLRIYLGTIYNAPDGAVVYYRDVSLESLGIQQISTEIPTGFSLEQNYPNPFNPETTIRFDIPAGEHIKLTVFNSLGQTVKELVNEKLSPGTYEYSFDGKELTSGFYFYKLQSVNFSETKKMLLVK